MNLIVIGLFSITGLLCFLILVIFFQGKNKPREIIRYGITLPELSQVWNKGLETGELDIAEIAPIWREEKETKKLDPENYIFQDERVAGFFKKHIDQPPWFQQERLHKDVCYLILTMLEQEGNCPSVVNAANDVEASWDSNTYTLLGRTSLLDHSLNVARETIKLLSEDDATHVIPDAMIAALGHDLGKLPSIKGHLYSLGEHPLAAGRVLAEIPAFKQLVKHDEISRAIKLHHKQPEGLLGQTLKKADQLARQYELEKTVQSEPVSPPAACTEKAHPPQGASAVWQAQADIYGEESPAKQKVDAPKLINISAWFDAEIFLDHLKHYINRISGRRFMAFSMANGYVYIQAKAMEEVTKKLAEQAGAMDVVTMAADDPTMRRVLFTVVHHLRENPDVIARELVKKRYFGGYFTITTKGGKTMKGFYTPFHAQAFGSLAVLEKNKTGLLKNFKSVEPYRK